MTQIELIAPNWIFSFTSETIYEFKTNMHTLILTVVDKKECAVNAYVFKNIITTLDSEGIHFKTFEDYIEFNPDATGSTATLWDQIDEYCDIFAFNSESMLNMHKEEIDYTMIKKDIYVFGSV
jgi:hypothetical protein